MGRTCWGPDWRSWSRLLVGLGLCVCPQLASGCSIAASSTRLALLCRDFEDNLGPADWLKDCIFWGGVGHAQRAVVCSGTTWRVQWRSIRRTSRGCVVASVMCTCLMC